MKEQCRRKRANCPFGCADPYPFRLDFEWFGYRLWSLSVEFFLLPFRAALRCV